MRFNLPDGWTVGRNTRETVPLYYKGIQVGRFEDDLYKANSKTRATAYEYDKNPPPKLYPIYFQEGRIQLKDVTDIAGMRYLVKSGCVSVQEALSQLPAIKTWLIGTGRLEKEAPRCATQYPSVEYQGDVYIKYPTGWKMFNTLRDGEDFPLYKRHYYKGVVGARVAFATGEATLYNVAEYSWGAVLEVVGDIVYQASKIFYEKFDKPVELMRDKLFDWSVDIERRGGAPHSRQVLKDCLHEWSVKLDSLKLPKLLQVIGSLKAVIVKEIKEIMSTPKQLVGFTEVKVPKGDSYEIIYQPRFNIKDFSNNVYQTKRFWKQLDKIFALETSGYAARLAYQSLPALVFKNGSSLASVYKNKIQFEEDRFTEQLTPYLPFLAERRTKYDKYETLREACQYVREDVKAMVALNILQPSDDRVYFSYRGDEYGLVLSSGKVFFSLNHLYPKGYIYIDPRYAAMPIDQIKKTYALTDEMFDKSVDETLKGFNRFRGYQYHLTRSWAKAEEIAAAKHLRITEDYKKRREEAAAVACAAANKDAIAIISNERKFVEWVHNLIRPELRNVQNEIQELNKWCLWRIQPVFRKYWINSKASWKEIIGWR